MSEILKYEDWKRERDKIKKDLFYFAYEYLGYRDLVKGLHDDMCEMLMNDEPVFFMIPRGHLKSSLVTIAKTLWDIIINPNRRVLIANAIFSKAIEFIYEIKQHSNKVELYSLFPEIFWEKPEKESPCWKRDALQFKTLDKFVLPSPTIQAMGIDGSIAGRHAEKIIFDDVENENNWDTPEKLQMLKNRYLQISKAVLIGGGLKIMAGTPYGKDDFYSWILDNEDYKLYKRAVIENETLIFPRHRKGGAGTTWEEVQSMMKNKHWFSCQMMCEPLADESATFEESWLSYYEQIPPIREIYIILDPSVGATKTSDNAVLLTIGKGVDNYFYVVNSQAYKTNPETLINAIFDEYLMWHKKAVVRVGIEVVTFSVLLKNWLQSQFLTRGIAFNVEELKPAGRHKRDRIKALFPYFANGMIKIKKEHEQLKYELLNFGITTKDDHADALAYLLDMAVIENSIEIYSPQTDILFNEASMQSDAIYDRYIEEILNADNF